MGDRQNIDTPPEVEPRVEDLLPEWLPAISKLAETAHRQMLTGLRQLTPAQKRSPEVAMAVGQIAGAAYKIRHDMEEVNRLAAEIYAAAWDPADSTRSAPDGVQP